MRCLVLRGEGRVEIEGDGQESEAKARRIGRVLGSYEAALAVRAESE